MKRILWVADLHYGSVVSPTAGRRAGANEVQKYLDARWKQMCDDVGPVDVVVANGDLCDGPNYKGRGLGIWETSLLEQVEGAVALLEMVDTKKYVGTQGSLYHTGDNVSTDHLVLKMLKGEFGEEMPMDVEKCGMYFRHSISVSSSTWQYRSTPVAKEMLLAVMNEAEIGKFRFMGFSHAHYYVGVQFGNTTGLIGPCWKGRDEFAKRRSLSMVPRLGYVVVEVDGDQVDFHAHIFTLKGEHVMPRVVIP